jgi:hypothetical protein
MSSDFFHPQRAGTVWQLADGVSFGLTGYKRPPIE